MSRKTIPFFRAAPSLLLTLAAGAFPGWSPPLPAAPPADAPSTPATKVKINSNFWELNGKRANPGSRAEGLLLNVRMANAVFEDRNPATCPKGFDPEKNTDLFTSKVPDYVAHGVRAFTISLQGASPGYEKALNSAYEADGSLRPAYMARAARAIEACDRAGAVVILSCLSADQDQVLKDAEAVKKAVTGTASWIKDRGYTNVVLEVASDFISKGYDHASIRDPVAMAELIQAAKKAAPDLLVSASGGGGGRADRRILTAADFILLHFNNVPSERAMEKVAAASKVSKAIVVNEDSKTGEEGARALEAAVDSFASWGYSNPKRNQDYPFKFEGAADDPPVYAKFKELTTPEK